MHFFGWHRAKIFTIFVLNKIWQLHNHINKISHNSPKLISGFITQEKVFSPCVCQNQAEVSEIENIMGGSFVLQNQEQLACGSLILGIQIMLCLCDPYRNMHTTQFLPRIHIEAIPDSSNSTYLQILSGDMWMPRCLVSDLFLT